MDCCHRPTWDEMCCPLCHLQCFHLSFFYQGQLSHSCCHHRQIHIPSLRNEKLYSQVCSQNRFSHVRLHCISSRDAVIRDIFFIKLASITYGGSCRAIPIRICMGGQSSLLETACQRGSDRVLADPNYIVGLLVVQSLILLFRWGTSRPQSRHLLKDSVGSNSMELALHWQL